MSALRDLAGAWLALAVAAAVAGLLGAEPATLLGFLGAFLWVHRDRLGVRPRAPWRSAAAWAWGVVAGWLLLSVSAAASWELPAACAPPAVGLLGFVSRCLLAPLFEEPLYRGRMLEELRRRLGNGSAVVATALLFAVPHPTPCMRSAAIASGIGLGALRLAGAPVSLCAGLHAGLNARFLVTRGSAGGDLGPVWGGG